MDFWHFAMLHACDATSSCQELTRAVAAFARHARNLMRHHVCSKMLSDCPVLWCTVQIGAFSDWPTIDRMPTAGFFRNQRCGYAANHSQADFFGNCNCNIFRLSRDQRRTVRNRNCFRLAYTYSHADSRILLESEVRTCSESQAG